MTRSAPPRRLGVVGIVLSLLLQMVMVGLGIAIFLVEDVTSSIVLLVLWCTVGSIYELVALIVLGRLSRRAHSYEERGPMRIELSRPTRILSFTATLLASLVGVTAAFQLITLRSDAQLGDIMNVVGVWAMLLAWGFLHWGFAQLYYQTYYSATEPPLRFPNTPHPRIVDFVYMSFTLGTSFAVSDVETLATGIRWRITWHSVVSFFFNGLIIVLALNTVLDMGK